MHANVHLIVTAQQHNSTTAQQHSSTTAQQHNSTTAQQHNSTTAQQHNSTTAQQHNSTTVCRTRTAQRHARCYNPKSRQQLGINKPLRLMEDRTYHRRQQGASRVVHHTLCTGVHHAGARCRPEVDERHRAHLVAQTLQLRMRHACRLVNQKATTERYAATHASYQQWATARHIPRRS